MIAVSSSGAGFRALAAYLGRGRTGLEEERIAWSSARNLPTADPEIAATLMRATAAQSVRVEKPVYHLVLAFDPGDPVDRAAMERVADRVLAQLGLERHQVLIVAHRDRAHPHLHLLVNRVHPETGKVWDRWQDMAAIQQVLREEERALGLRAVPGLQHAPALDGAAFHTRDPTSSSDRQLSDLLSLGANGPADGAPTSTAVPTLVERARAVLPTVREAATWRDFNSILEQAGLRVERRGSGLVVTDGERYAKASTVGPDLTLRRLEARLGPHSMGVDLAGAVPDAAEQARVAHGAYHRGVAPAAGDLQVPMFAPSIGGARSREVAYVARQVAQLEQAQHVDAGYWEAVQVHSAARARLAQLDTAVARYDGASRSLGALFMRIYREPDCARTNFDATAQDHGVEAAAAQLRLRPETYGTLIAEGRSRAFGLAKLLGDGAAERMATEGASVALEVTAAERALAQALAAESITERGTERSSGRTIAAERALRMTALGHSTEREQALAAERRALPSAYVLEQGIREGMRRLMPHEVRQLHAMLTRPQGALLARVRYTTREAVLGRDSGD